ncbi:MAG TPA: ATP-binding cassette domain-containing protein [Chloroflexota bacterium]|nr:ATP-binding cassette domain-containing protein [Chloroflexota bacterium]
MATVMNEPVSADQRSAAAYVRLRNVTKLYRSRRESIAAVSNINLDIGTSEFVSLLGPHGCGKSTLMSMVAGLIPVSSGTVSIAGRTVKKAQTEIGTVFSDPILLDSRSVLENVLLQAEIRDLDEQEYRPRAEKLIELAGLKNLRDTQLFGLSPMYRQLVAVCRAFVHDPPLLLLDEPFNALDPAHKQQAILNLQQLWMYSPKTVLYIASTIAEAVLLSDRIIVMTAAPGTIAADISIPVPRPRRVDPAVLQELRPYAEQVRRVFDAHGVQPEDQPAA